METDAIKAMIETALKTEIVKALNNAPDAIEKLVTAAISQQVDKHTGSSDRGYYGDKVPYLDFLIGCEIRRAATEAVSEVFATKKEDIKARIKERFSSDDIVDSFASALVKTSQESWQIKVSFESNRI